MSIQYISTLIAIGAMTVFQFPSAGYAGSKTICLGKDLSKVLSSDSYFVKVEKSELIELKRKGGGCFKDIPSSTSKTRVMVFFKGAVVESWKLDFAKLKSDSVLIWRSAGSWRMEPVSTCRCDDL